MKKAIKQSTMMLILNAASLLFLTGVVVGFLCFANVNNKMTRAENERYDLTYNANRFMNGSSYLTSEVRAYAATGKQEHYDNYWNEINNLKNRDLGVAALKDIGITQGEQAMIDEMSGLSNQLVPLEEEAMENVKAGRRDAAIQYVYGEEYEAAIAKINSIKTDFLAALDQRSLAEVRRLEGVCVIIQTFLFVMIVGVAVMQVVSVFYTRRKIIRPVTQIRDEMGEIAAGNLSSAFHLPADTSEIGVLTSSTINTKRELKKYIDDISKKLSAMAGKDMDQQVEINYLGDFAPIKTALESILDSLNSVLRQLDEAAAQVSSGSEQVSVGVQTLSQGVTEQANSVEELATTIGEISQQIQQNAQHAQEAKEMSQHAGDEVMAGNQKMQEMIAAMSEISKKSDEIAKIIKTVEDISFQTNILALNAAVEAARAGSAGKGFAVVADEVRNLASKSAEAAKNITGLIEESLRAVDNGSRIADQTAQALLGVVDGATKVNVLVDQIAEASNRQAVSITSISQGVEQIAAVVQSNSAISEESAAASMELTRQAQLMRRLAGQFHLRASRGPALRSAAEPPPQPEFAPAFGEKY